MPSDLHIFSVTPSVKYWPVTLALAGFIVLTGAIMLALDMLPAVGAIVFMCAGLVMTIQPALKAGNTEYVIMSDRVIAYEGVFKKTAREIMLSDVQAIRIDWGKFGDSLDVGVLELVGSAGTLTMEGVESPEKVRDRILSLK
ncbi:MAG: PH domain-containing protein [Elusimicrobia bacterium]|nr:PH domain-containing protein [Elusimicrobiota bacterium]